MVRKRQKSCDGVILERGRHLGFVPRPVSYFSRGIRLVVSGDPDTAVLYFYLRVDLVGLVVGSAITSWPTADIENMRFRRRNMPFDPEAQFP